MYNTMFKLIFNLNAKYKNKMISIEEYQSTCQIYQKRLDAFVNGGRITSVQYEELCNMFIKED